MLNSFLDPHVHIVFCQVVFKQITPNSSDIDGSPAY